MRGFERTDLHNAEFFQAYHTVPISVLVAEGLGCMAHCPYISQLDCMAEMEKGAEGLRQAEGSARRWHLAFWLFNARKKHFSFYRITSEEINSPGVSQPLVNLLGVLVGFVLNVLDL